MGSSHLHIGLLKKTDLFVSKKSREKKLHKNKNIQKRKFRINIFGTDLSPFLKMKTKDVVEISHRETLK